MIKFRKARRESELSLMSRGDADRRGSAISLTGLRRDSVNGELFLSVPQNRRDRRASTDQGADDDVKVLPAITIKGVDDDLDNVSIRSDEITIDVSALTSKAKVKDAAKVKDDAKVNDAAKVKDALEVKVNSGDRRVSTLSMVYGEGKGDLKVNNDGLVRRIWMNILVMSVSFMLMFSSISALASLQSTIHEGNLGVVGLSVNFGTVVVSCLVVPHLAIRYLGYKWTVTISMLGGVGWMVSNMFARWETVIPGSILLGLSWAPMWTAHSAYVTSLAKKYALLTAVPKEEAITKFFGVFYTMFLTAPVWGNLVSAGVFGGFGGGGGNSTVGVDEEEAQRELLQYCGASFCPLVEVPLNQTAVQVERPTFAQIATLVGVNVGITLVGCLITAIFVDRETSPKLQLPPEVAEEAEEQRTMKELLLSTIKQTIRKKQMLLMPFTIYAGLEQAFLLAEFTSAFIGCAAGIEYVSLCVICYGIVGGIFAVITGKLAHSTGRVPIFVTAAVLHISLMIFLLTWHIEPSHLPLFFIVPALWGIGDSVFQSQINSMYGNVFCDNSEAAFANYRMWESVGFILGYGYSGLLCVYVKIYILIALLVISVLGYLVVEFWLKRKALQAEEEKSQEAKTEAKSEANMANGTTGSPFGNEVLEASSTHPVKRPVKKTSASSAPTLDTMMESDV